MESYPTPDNDTADPVVQNAASILEFLSWGRKKNPDFHDVSLEASEAMGNPSDVRDVDPGPAFATYYPGSRPDDLNLIQILLPDRRQVWELETYHAESVLWYHGSYHAATFRRQLHGFYDRFNGRVDSPGVNLQWVAMLFSVLTGSMAAVPEDKALSWGFREPERGRLSRQWYRAAIQLLNLAEFTANQSILSTQAIATLTHLRPHPGLLKHAVRPSGRRHQDRQGPRPALSSAPTARPASRWRPADVSGAS